MGVVVTFDYPTWAAQYPPLAPYINPTQAAACFVQATMLQANDGSGLINDPTLQLNLLNLLVSHVATLFYPTTGAIGNPDPASPLVGRVANAAEGSVSFGSENDYPPGSPQWYQQTKWGSMWWEATAQFRTMQYVARVRSIAPYGNWLFAGRPFGVIGFR
jgi:Protein of unknown function (DUF4054)